MKNIVLMTKTVFPKYMRQTRVIIIRLSKKHEMSQKICNILIVGWLVGWVLWRINLCRLFNAKFCLSLSLYIYIPFTNEKESLSVDSECSTFYKNVLNCVCCLTRQTLWLWFLFQYESVSKPCMIHAQSGYNDLFSSRCSKSWSPFSQGGLNLEEFIIDVHVPSLWPFFVKEFTDYRFQIGTWNGDSFRA